MKFLIILLVLINVLLLSLFVQKQSSSTPASFPPKVGNYPEIHELEGKNLKFPELKKFFQDLANQKGAEYAYEVLRIAPIPQGTDMHLMGHVIGDVLYAQQGAQGIKVCTQDFRNACSHSIVVGLLKDKGEGALEDISNACKQAPGGSGAYTMCYHGLGHGVLAYLDFDIRKAIDLCGKVQDAGFSGPEATQCVSGAIMEIISGGDHDKETWKRQRAIYLKDQDPLYPCNSEFMPDNARPLCYVYLTPHLFQVAGANLGNPQPEHFKKAFRYCSKIPKVTGNFDSCYGGFGKEFVVLAAGRDIRMNALGNVEKDQFKKVYNWCKLADQEEGVKACINHATNSYFWGGENSPDIAIGFCSGIEEENLQTLCFRNFTESVNIYVKDQNYRAKICQQLPQKYLEECKKKLL